MTRANRTAQSTMTRALALSALAGFLLAPWAQAATEPAAKEALKQIQGAVSAVNKHGIAVDYERSETASKEIYLPFASKLTVQGVKSLSDLHMGDTVMVEYKELLEKDERGALTKSSRVAVRVVFLAPAPPPAPAAAEPEDAS